jgi:intergrase/recombinase
MKKSDKRTSADFDDFLKEEGILDEVRQGALKKVAGFRKSASRQAPIFLSHESQVFVERIARKRKQDVSIVVDELILRNKRLVDLAK